MGRGGAGGAIVRRQSIASISSANCADVKVNVPWTDRVRIGGCECGVRLGSLTVDERLRELSARGDELERLNAFIDFELFRGDLERAVPRSDRSRGGRPAFDHVLVFKALILQASHSLSDERTEYLIKDRLSPLTRFARSRRPRSSARNSCVAAPSSAAGLAGGD
jgi:hypothetical protein